MEKIDRKPLGAIDALSAGFELVLRRPWILLVPLALDLFLWLGPQIQAKPVFEQMLRVLFAAAAAQSGSPETQQALEAFTQTLQVVGDQFNAFSFVALFGIGLPSIVPLGSPDFLKPMVLFSIQDEATFLGWAVVLALLGVLVGSIYLEAIARHVRQDGPAAAAFAPRVLKSFTHVVALALTLGLAALVLIIPFGLGALLISILSPGLGVFVILLIWLLLMWAGLYLAFAIPAIFISGANAAQAILNSVTIFRHNFWPAMGLVFLIVLIQMGFSIIWQQWVESTVGLIVDMVANAILGTALVAAGMLFYHDRFSWLTQVRQRIHQQQRPSIKG